MHYSAYTIIVIEIRASFKAELTGNKANNHTHTAKASPRSYLTKREILGKYTRNMDKQLPQSLAMPYRCRGATVYFVIIFTPISDTVCTS